MHEAMLLKKKVNTSGGISISGAGVPSSWTKSSGVTSESDGTYTFTGSSIDYIRIPYGTSPYPIGQDMEIRMNAVVYSQTNNGNSLYLLGKWMQVSGQGEFCLQRWNDGTIRLSIGSISENIYQTTTGPNNVIALNTPFDFFWQRKGSSFLAMLNGNTIYSASLAAERQCNVDWVVGSYLNQSNGIVGTQYATAGNWKLNSLSITPGTTV